MPKTPIVKKYITINKNTINNYFNSAPATAIPVAAPAGPPPIFTTNAERDPKTLRGGK